MQRRHAAPVVGELEHVFAVVGVVLNGDPDDVFKVVGHGGLLALFLVVAGDSHGAAIDRDRGKFTFLLLFLKTPVRAEYLKSRTASAIAG